jgi:hypothetical protein
MVTAEWAKPPNRRHRPLTTRRETVMSVRSTLVVASSMAAAMLATLVAATPAAARPSDRGIQGADCVVGEICFSDFGGTQNNHYRHFFWDADHRGDWFDASNSTRLEDNIEGYRNLDSACDVYVWDITSTGQWFVYSWIQSEYPPVLRTRTYRTYSVGDRNRNNGHTRCHGSNPPIGL